MFKIEEYTSHWNDFVREWQKDPKKAFDLNVFGTAYRGEGEKAGLKCEYLPEPYFGDPNNCSAVIINKNPGGVIEQLQHFQTGRFIKEDQAHENYYAFALDFPYLTTYTDSPGNPWWDKRRLWINRLLQLSGKTTKLIPFALELCPWHSNEFRSNLLRIDDAFLNHFRATVISPAEFANAHSALKIILSCGSIFNKLYQIVGFKKLEEVSRNDFPEGIAFPLLHGMPVRGKYSLWQSPNGHWYLNFVHGTYYNFVPNRYWENVEKHLIELALNLREPSPDRDRIKVGGKKRKLELHVGKSDPTTKQSQKLEQPKVKSNLSIIIEVATLARQELERNNDQNRIEVVRCGEKRAGTQCHVYLRPVGLKKPTTQIVENPKKHLQNESTLLKTEARILDVNWILDKIDDQKREMRKKGLSI